MVKLVWHVCAVLLAAGQFELCRAAGTTAAGVKYLAVNGKKEGVVTTDSGLQYRIITSGPTDETHFGGKSPLPATQCDCHYWGALIDGTVFDSSYRRDAIASFAPNQVIKGWTEALQLMKEGDKWELWVPSELAYGDKSRGKFIKPGSSTPAATLPCALLRRRLLHRRRHACREHVRRRWGGS